MRLLIGDAQEIVDHSNNQLQSATFQTNGKLSGIPGVQSLAPEVNDAGEKRELHVGYKNIFNHKKQYVMQLISH